MGRWLLDWRAWSRAIFVAGPFTLVMNVVFDVSDWQAWAIFAGAAWWAFWSDVLE